VGRERTRTGEERNRVDADFMACMPKSGMMAALRSVVFLFAYRARAEAAPQEERRKKEHHGPAVGDDNKHVDGHQHCLRVVHVWERFFRNGLAEEMAKRSPPVFEVEEEKAISRDCVFDRGNTLLVCRLQILPTAVTLLDIRPEWHAREYSADLDARVFFGQHSGHVHASSDDWDKVSPSRLETERAPHQHVHSRLDCQPALCPGLWTANREDNFDFLLVSCPLVELAHQVHTTDIKAAQSKVIHQIGHGLVSGIELSNHVPVWDDLSTVQCIEAQSLQRHF
jgi:hypothetical protein